MLTNQITGLPARAPLAARVAAKTLRVYKASPVVLKPFGLGFSSGEVKVR